MSDDFYKTCYLEAKALCDRAIESGENWKRLATWQSIAIIILSIINIVQAIALFVRK